MKKLAFYLMLYFRPLLCPLLTLCSYVWFFAAVLLFFMIDVDSRSLYWGVYSLVAAGGAFWLRWNYDQVLLNLNPTHNGMILY